MKRGGWPAQGMFNKRKRVRRERKTYARTVLCIREETGTGKKTSYAWSPSLSHSQRGEK